MTAEGGAPGSSGSAGGPSIWVVSDGRAGIERQALSLARALGSMERWRQLAHMRSPQQRKDPIRLQPGGPQLLLPADRWPAPLAALPDDQRALLAAPWPDVWIASGRRSIPYSRLVKTWSKGRTLVVQTQNPKVDLAAFDLVIPPLHDGLSGPNVLSILGAPTYFGPEEVEEAHLRFGELARLPGLKVLVAIGGDSKTHRMSERKIGEIESVLRNIARHGARLWITVSRRTPELARGRLRVMAEELAARFWENPVSDGPNPYLAWLSLCDAALVTEDSANMLADPAWFGKPTHLIRLEGRSDRFDRLHQGFIESGSARWFEGKIEIWAYAPIREVERAADAILQLLLRRHPLVQAKSA